MSRATKKKYVMNEVLSNADRVPHENEKIVKLIRGCGNNLHEVQVMDGSEEKFLVSMPSKFRKTVWIKRGDYLLVEPIAEGDKVKGEITEILNKNWIKYLKNQGCWYEDNIVVGQIVVQSDEDDIPMNLNRVNAPAWEEDSSSDSE